MLPGFDRRDPAQGCTRREGDEARDSDGSAEHGEAYPGVLPLSLSP